MRMCDLHVQNTHGYKNLGVRVQYARTILMTKFVSRALYAIPRVCIQSEVYFGLNGKQTWLAVLNGGLNPRLNLRFNPPKSAYDREQTGQ